jgi:hypothetical protein
MDTRDRLRDKRLKGEKLTDEESWSEALAHYNVDEAGRDGFVRAHRRVVGERPRRISPAVAVDVEGVEVGVHPEGVDLHVLADLVGLPPAPRGVPHPIWSRA